MFTKILLLNDKHEKTRGMTVAAFGITTCLARVVGALKCQKISQDLILLIILDMRKCF